MFTFSPTAATIQVVTEVPKLAPNTTPSAAVNESKPAPTKPMQSRVVALED